MPTLNLAHLQRMTDDTGMLQHAVAAIPNPNEGYTTDDNARALIVAVKLDELMVPGIPGLAPRYMGFLWHAFNPEVGRFRNVMGYDRHWHEAIGSEDSHARALWALGTTLGRSTNPSLIEVASRLFASALPAARSFIHPRAAAFTLLGLHEYIQRYASDLQAQQLRTKLAESLLERFTTRRSEDWRWCDPELSYDNAVLPHALLLCGDTLGRFDMRDVALDSLAWLMQRQCDETGYFVPIGCHGFAHRGGETARFDQQPLEAHATVLATLAAARITGSHYWQRESQRAFDWFLGRNDLGLSLYDPLTGGCHDGLLTDRINQNQGAESTLAFLLSWLEMQHTDEEASLVLIPETATQLAQHHAAAPRNGKVHRRGSS